MHTQDQPEEYHSLDSSGTAPTSMTKNHTSFEYAKQPLPHFLLLQQGIGLELRCLQLCP